MAVRGNYQTRTWEIAQVERMLQAISIVKRILILCAAIAGIASCTTPRIPEPAPPRGAREPDVVFVPTPHAVVDKMFEVARVGPGDVLYDLGSGDGRIVIAAARRFGIRATGIDIDPQRIVESRRNADTARVAHLVEFREADLFATDLRSASVVTLYLLPELNVKLRPKLFSELRPGSRVVSHSFDMGDWKADSILVVNARMIFYWVIPADVEGTWVVETESAEEKKRFDVQLGQQYQRITRVDPSAVVGDVLLRGDTVRLAIRDDGVVRHLVGRVTADSMEGTLLTRDGRPGTWRARRTGRTGR